MKFDKRITDISKIMNCYTTEDAKKYLHTHGYFADHIEDFAKLDKNDIYELVGIEQEFKYPYSVGYYKFKFFLPCAFVKEEEEKKEKKYEPFTIQEFEDFAIEQPFQIVEYRDKDKRVEYHSRYNGYIIHNDGDIYNIYIILGNSTLDLKTLLDNYELFINYEWQPFGVEVMEDK